jgi:hypothetical protein
MQTARKNLLSREIVLVITSMSLHFDALSYEWKQSEGSIGITCNGVSLPVTRNLASALRALRLPSNPRVLWVDAVCIDQNNPEEKPKQIPLMREIYTSAKSVLTWLGPDFPGVQEAFQIFPYLSRVHYSPWTFPSRTRTYPRARRTMTRLISCNQNRRC